MLDCQLFGLQPWGHHLTSLVLHAIAVILLFLALRVLTKETWASGLVAALFAVHPLRVESVVWISERKDVLSVVFFALTLLAYGYYARTSKSSWYVAAIAGFTCGLLSKPSLVPLPFVLLLIDYWPLGRFHENNLQRPAKTWKRLLTEKIPFFLLSAGSCFTTVFAQAEAITEMGHVAAPVRLSNAILSFVVYLRQIFWPTRLAAFYLFPSGHIHVAAVVLSATSLLLLSIIICVYRERFPFLLTGWFWYVGMLIPVIGLVQVGNQAHADRYTYLPTIGIYIGMTWLYLELSNAFRYRAQIGAAIGVLILIALIPQTRAQTAYWRNSITLWQHAAEVTENNYQAYTNLGISLLGEGRINEAIAEHRRAIAINPNFAESHRAFADALIKGGEINEAIGEYEKAIRIRPNYPDADRNLGDALLQNGRVDEAIEHYQKSLLARPNYPEAQNNLGNALASQGRYAEAATAFEEALRIDPRYPDANNNLGSVLLIEGKLEPARQAFEQAVRINPNYAEAHYNLGLALIRMGRRSDAAAEFAQALRIRPNYSQAERALQLLQRDN